MTPRRARGRRANVEAGRRYPRTARVNEALREVLASTIERLADSDERLALLTVTAVETDADLRRARILFASLRDDAREALEECRLRLQAAVARQVRLKWTPLLSFAADPAISTGQRVEDLLRQIQPADAPETPGHPDG